jgi:hypothetical protein
MAGIDLWRRASSPAYMMDFTPGPISVSLISRRLVEAGLVLHVVEAISRCNGGCNARETSM